MFHKILLIFTASIFLLAVPVFAVANDYDGTSDVFYGGGIGFGLGDVEYIELSPMIGLRFSPQFSAGVGVTYRWRSDKRFAEDLETEDYGATVFSRFHISSEIYLQAEYEYLNYERYTVPGAGFPAFWPAAVFLNHWEETPTLMPRCCTTLITTKMKVPMMSPGYIVSVSVLDFDLIFYAIPFMQIKSILYILIVTLEQNPGRF